MNHAKKVQLIKDHIYEIKDFPKNGIIFRDCTPILLNPKILTTAIKLMAQLVEDLEFDVIVAPESRGYLFGLPLAILTKKSFITVRKPNKLPRKTVSATYQLEYGKDTLQMHQDDIKPGQRVLIVDDVLATGGTVSAVIDLVKQVNATVVGSVFLIELPQLKGRIKNQIPTFSLIQF